MLDNDEVIAKLASVLSIQLIYYWTKNKRLWSQSRLNNIATDIRAVNRHIQAIEHENTKLKQLHDGLRATVDGLAAKGNLLEQASRKCSLIISGVQKTYA